MPPHPIVDVIKNFFRGVILGPAMVLASQWCVSPHAFLNDAGTGSTKSTPDVIGILFAIVALAIVCTFFGAATYSLFKTRSGRPLPYTIGILVAFVPWGIIGIYDQYDADRAFILVGIGTALAGVGFWSARRGLAAHHRKFRPGLGNACAHCHYDLSATAEGQVCPECGGTLRYNSPAPKPGV